jgi:hypothetical protein
MTVNLSALAGAGAQFLDGSGNPLSGGKLESFVAGTTTPQTTYTEASGAVAHPNPIILDAAGRVPTGEIWITAGASYKFVLSDSNNVVIATYDNITGIDGTGIATNATSVSFTGFKGQVGNLQDLADADGSDWVGFEPAGSNAVARSVQDKLREYVSVKDFGAVGNGVADDTLAVQAAFDACAASGQGLYFPAGTYNASSALTMGNHDLNMEGQLVYTGSAAITFLRVTAPSRNVRVNLLNSNVNNPSSWSNDNLVGVRFTGFQCNIQLTFIRGFAIGAQFGVDAPFVWSTVQVGRMEHCRIFLDLRNNTISEYVNQNTFIGGLCNINSSLAAAFSSYSRYGIRIGSISNTYYNNNNTFINNSFELRSNTLTGGAEAAAVLMDNGRENTFISIRSEDSATGAAVIEKNDSYRNSYNFGFISASANSVNFQSQVIESKFSSSRTIAREIQPYLIFDSGLLYEKANLYNGTDSVSIDGVHFQGSSSSTPSISSSLITINPTNVQFGQARSIGVFVDNPGIANFAVLLKTTGGTARIRIACFDSSGNRLTDADPDHPYVTGIAIAGYTYGTIFGGAYGPGSNQTSAFFSTRSSNVAKIQILISGGNGDTISLQGFEIWCNKVLNVYSGVPNLDRRQKLGTAAPSAGTWQVGDMIFNAAPAAGGTIGWVCVTAGTPGTWKTFGAISA